MNGFQLPLPWPILAGAALMFMLASYLMLVAVDRQERLKTRLSRVTGQDSAIDLPRPREGAKMLDALATFGAALAKSGVLSDTTRRQLEQTIAQAGLRGTRVFGMFIGSKFLLMVLLPALAYGLFARTMTGTNFYIAMGGAVAVGMLSPDFFIKSVRKKHLKQVEKGLPDALDMMVICAQAGLGLETAIDRVAQEFVFANKAVATELAICASEMRIGTDRRIALIALGERTGIDSMRRLAGTLIQTMQFGTPLSQALRILAAEMRTDNLTKFEGTRGTAAGVSDHSHDRVHPAVRVHRRRRPRRPRDRKNLLESLTVHLTGARKSHAPRLNTSRPRPHRHHRRLRPARAGADRQRRAQPACRPPGARRRAGGNLARDCARSPRTAAEQRRSPRAGGRCADGAVG